MKPSNDNKFPPTPAPAPEDEESNVVPINSDDEIVLVCACGCKSFWLHETAAVQCTNCQKFMNDVEGDTTEWRNSGPPKPDPDKPIKTDAGAISEAIIGNREFARRSVLKTIERWGEADHLAAVIAYNKDAHGKMWVDVETQEQKEWLIRQLEGSIEYFEKLETD